MEKNLKQVTSNCLKIVIYGPESTGKTTLAESLANHYNTQWVAEFARAYLQKKWNETQELCVPADLLPIAKGQMQAENEASILANKWLFLDTNLLTTKVYSDVYYQSCNETLRKFAEENEYQFYFLTDIDTPWIADDLRDKPNERLEMFEAFEQELIRLKLPYMKLSGNAEKRFNAAVSFLNHLESIFDLGLNAFDALQTYNMGIPATKLANEFEIFEDGVSKIILDRPATLQDGIISLEEAEANYYEHFFDLRKSKLKLKKFVPASGAASRMFKFLSEFLNEYNPAKESINGYMNRRNAKSLQIFLVGLPQMPFYKSMVKYLKETNESFSKLDKDSKSYLIIRTMLEDPNFDYANKPKGILPFHDYGDEILSPIQEHLKEAVSYASADGRSYLHFTVSPEHQTDFETIVRKNVVKFETDFNTKIQVRFSYQHKITDTLSVNADLTPFRLKDGSLFFRPGGHGALIENLNQLNADIIFIKNIDNVIQNHSDTISHYKKVLGGILLSTQEQVFNYLRKLEASNLDKDFIDEVIQFMESKLHLVLIPELQYFTKEYKIEYLRKHLNRPIRVCGMVKNEDEPGGGPFWVRDDRGNCSLQIVESAQVDVNVVKQRKIMERSTHFNPVDLVCGMKNYQGNPFDLTEFVDHESGFITEKSKDGKSILAYELPGLWNGAMAKWITIFVEMPLITFNPVKTVNDLLKPNHQPQ